ncbi:MAG: hypothetical protein KF861_17220 [Planctomycetaceae bacterium]|nr:hypothetical protein [Planctomycetaceae bacterium]
MTTEYHSQYYAYQLTKRLASDNSEKLSQSLLNATVDLNPHQVEAALFAFRSPLSRGAILADEVGLGKTIEAGLIVSQLWAERKRHILCIVPANLRKQWNRELLEKFFTESVILEAKSYRAFKKEHGRNPFDQDGTVVICSYQFARSRVDEMQRVSYSLSDGEAELYKHVTDYVREEFNRAEALENEGRKGRELSASRSRSFSVVSPLRRKRSISRFVAAGNVSKSGSGKSSF